VGCGFYDPHALYDAPTVHTLVYNGAAHAYRGEGMGGFDIDLIDVILAPSADGSPLTLEFSISDVASAGLDIRVLHLADVLESGRPRHALVLPAAPVACAERAPDGRLVCVLPEIHTAAYTRLGLIVTRVGGEESLDLGGEYTLVLRPGLDRASVAVGKPVQFRPYGSG
jgi:hypothetical protein